MTDEVLVTIVGQVASITLNRPERLNAVSADLYRGIIDALDLAAGDGTRVVVLRGAGRAFCVGADMKTHAAGERTPAELRNYVELGQQACMKIQSIPVPVIAAVHGYALGAGAEIATSADFLLMTDEAQMGFPEVSIGTFVGGAVTRRLPRLVGLRRAAELLTLGQRFTGGQAAQWGLAHASVPAATLEEHLGVLTARICASAPLSMAAMKEALRLDRPLDETLAAEAETLISITQTHDWAEGVAAFAERRPPVFEGR